MTDPAQRAPSSGGAAERDAEEGGPRLSAVIGDWLRSLAGLGPRAASLRESVAELVAEHGGGATAVDEQERAMLLNLLAFGEQRVEDVMVPRADIVAVPVTATLAEVAAAMAGAGHSRLPVFEDSLDNVVGMVHVRDLLPYWRGDAPFDLPRVARSVPFVPPSMPIPKLLRQMRTAKVHMALVVDEHGGIDGLATIEDLVEEIVGEIEDEHDRSAPPALTERADGGLDASARAPIAALEERLGVDLLPAERDEQIDTVGGLIFALAGRVPAVGEVIRHECGAAFEVLEADPRRIRRVRVHPAPADSAAS